MQPGKLIGQYQILEKLGRGGMGVVYTARDTKLDRTVALKFLPPHMSTNEEAKQRFIQEAKAASALDHANICTIHDIAETEDGELYIVMAYYEGQTMKYRLENEEFAIDDALDVARQLGRALERAHEAGIIHRDLKPANIMVTDRGEVKLLDFGLAKLMSGLDLTAEGSTLGTAAYMSPEQARGEELDARTDIWSFGIVLYEMLAGRKPFRGDYDQALLYAILNEDPPPIDEQRSDMPDALSGSVTKCLQKDRESRYDSMTALLTDIDTGTAPIDSGRADVRSERTVSRAMLLSIIGTFAVLVIAGLVYLASRGDDASGDSVSSDVIAVLPFAVRGSPDLAYLGEGMVDLISQKLDGAGSLRALNPRAVISLINRETLDIADPASGSRVARKLGAGRYVTGDLLEVGGRLRLTAYLTDTDQPNQPLGEAAVEGAAENLFDVIDDLVTDLLGGLMTGPGGRLQKLAVGTSSSIDATKEYLIGEQLLRAGQYREAAAAYDRAVAIDSTFALAYYRKSVAAEWIDAADIRAVADRAVQFADKLSQRDQNLLKALRYRRHGETDKSEKVLRDHLHTYPDEIEALSQLGEIYFHENPRMGRSTLESRIPFEHLVELEDGNLIAQIHLARLDAAEGKLDLLAQRAELLAARAPDSERAVEVEAIYAFATRDTARQTRVREKLSNSPWFYTFYTAHGVSRYARDVHGAAEILDGRPSNDPLLLFMVPELLIARGKLSEYRQFMQSPTLVRNPTWDVTEAFILTSGIINPEPRELMDLRERIRRADPQDVRSTGFVRPPDDITERFLQFEIDFNVGLLSVWLDDEREARDALARLEAADEFEGLGSIRNDAARSLEAEILYRAGDREGALVQLRQIEYQIPHSATVRPFTDGTRSRFLRSELEYAIGDVETARNFLLGLDQSWSPLDMFVRAPVYERLGQIAEDLGDTEEAIRQYTLLLNQWRDCDAELIPRREGIRERLHELLGRSTREPGELAVPAAASASS
jgi:serine/threonine protein kinase/tetratricopeptide (TPR) repeat protein